jgi:glycosyltransferase involved in cell wall biosynthesis
MDPRTENAAARDDLAGLRVVMLVMNDVRHDARVQKEARALAEAGAVVTIIGVERDGSTGWSSARFEVRLIEPMRPSTHRLWPVRVLANLWREWAVWRRMVRAGLDAGPTAVHAHDLDTAWPAMQIAERLGVPLVYDAHELYTERSTIVSWRKRVLERIERRMLRVADLVLSASPERADIMLSKYGVDRAILPILNIPPAASWVDGPSDAALAARAGIPQRRLLIYQGGIDPRRGLEAILEAVPSLPHDVGLVLLGNDPSNERLKRLVSTAVASGRVYRWPAVEPAEIPAWVAAADAGIVTYMPDSLNNTYCAPNKLYDYAAAGVAILGADLPPVRDALTATGTGILFTPGDPGSFISAVEELFAADVRLDRAREGARRLRERQTWEEQAVKLTVAYAALHAPVPGDRRSS